MSVLLLIAIAPPGGGADEPDRLKPRNGDSPNDTQPGRFVPGFELPKPKNNRSLPYLSHKQGYVNGYERQEWKREVWSHW